MTLKKDPNFEKKLTCFKNDMRILVNFKQTVENLKM